VINNWGYCWGWCFGSSLVSNCACGEDIIVGRPVFSSC